LKNLTLLLVDDEPINRFVASRLLEKNGFTVHAAAGGAEALQKLADVAVDAVLLDLSMPDMDGFETAERLRAMPGPVRRVPIIALSTNDMPQTQDRCRQSGFQGFMSKPIQIPVLVRLLSEIRPSGGASAADTSDPGRLTDLRAQIGDAALGHLIALARSSVAEGEIALAAAGSRGAGQKAADIAERLAGALETMGLVAQARILRDCDKSLRCGKNGTVISTDPARQVLHEARSALDAMDRMVQGAASPS